MLCEDIESNPGPRPNSGQSFSICHWNLNSMAAHNFFKSFRLTLSWRRPVSYRNQSTDLRSKSMDWFLYNNGLRHERVKGVQCNTYLWFMSLRNLSQPWHFIRQWQFVDTRLRINLGWSPIKSETRRYLYISQRCSPYKNKQYKLFEGMFKFQPECLWETV